MDVLSIPVSWLSSVTPRSASSRANCCNTARSFCPLPCGEVSALLVGITRLPRIEVSSSETNAPYAFNLRYCRERRHREQAQKRTVSKAGLGHAAMYTRCWLATDFPSRRGTLDRSACNTVLYAHIDR